jgi:hypothetical protein
MSAECSPQKSEALGGASAVAVSSPSSTDRGLGGGAVVRFAAGPNGTSSSRGPSQSRGRRTTLLLVVPSSVSGPSLSTRRRPSVAETRR